MHNRDPMWKTETKGGMRITFQNLLVVFLLCSLMPLTVGGPRGANLVPSNYPCWAVVFSITLPAWLWQGTHADVRAPLPFPLRAGGIEAAPCHLSVWASPSHKDDRSPLHLSDPRGSLLQIDFLTNRIPGQWFMGGHWLDMDVHKLPIQCQ